jgi:hypothetical protein
MNLHSYFVVTEGDWEEDHEKLAEITEQSRIRSSSYGNGNDNDNHIESDDHADLDLEASISQLMLEDYDDSILENGEAAKPQTLVRNIFYFIKLLRKISVVTCCISQYSAHC